MEKNKKVFMAVTVFAGAALAAFGVVYLFKYGKCVAGRIMCGADTIKKIYCEALPHKNDKVGD